MIIKSLLDLDFYKLTMCQLVFHHFPNLKVRFKFKNRTKINLASYIPVEQIKEQFEFVKTLRFKKEEIDFLRKQKIFSEDFLNFLLNFKMPDISVTIVDGELNIETEREEYWKKSILWETIVLSIVNELYYVNKYSTEEIQNSYSVGRERLKEKIRVLKDKEIPKIITDFGTRRRFSQEWHEYVVSQIKDQPFFAGTSNVYLAFKYDIPCIGTNAHELYMVSAGYYGEDDNSLLNSHSIIMNKWYEEYGFNLSVGLTDTFGTKFFFEDFKKIAEKWKGVRHDSGDAFDFGEDVISYYKNININPIEKLIVFSDGLNLNKIINLYETFVNRIKMAFGWGTKLTNDLGFETLSIVMKAVEVVSDGDREINRTLVKLSDNLNKHTGDENMIEWYKKVFNYINTKSEKLIV